MKKTNILTFIKGDILQGIPSDFESIKKPIVVLHGCNCHHIMGAGIAAYLRNKFPEIYAIDCKTEKSSRAKLGTYSTVWIHDKLVILNCYTQYNIGLQNGPPVDYTAVRSCLKSVNTEFNGWEIRSPMIGCGLAGGDWNVVKSIFVDELCDQDVKIYYI